MKIFNNITKFVYRKLDENKKNSEQIMKFLCDSIGMDFRVKIQDNSRKKYEQFFDKIYGKVKK